MGVTGPNIEPRPSNLAKMHIFLIGYAKNTGHLEWNALGDFSEFKTNGDSKEAL